MVITLKPQYEVSQEDRLSDWLEVVVGVMDLLVLDFKVTIVVAISLVVHGILCLFLQLWLFRKNQWLGGRFDLNFIICESEEDFLSSNLAQIQVVRVIVLFQSRALHVKLPQEQTLVVAGFTHGADLCDAFLDTLPEALKQLEV